MKKNYITALMALFLSVTMSAQIVQVTDINKSGDSGISSPYAWNGKIYFEADAGNDSVEINGNKYPVGDELYVYDGESATLLANINVDTADTSPNSDPKNFFSYNGKLYFQANGGDNTGVDAELYVTDGTTEGTELVYDIYPGPGKGGLPMEFFIMDETLYFYAKDGSNSQIWKYDGANTPEKVTNERSGGYFNPFFPTVDGSRTWLKGITDLGKYQLCLFQGDSIISLTANNVANAYFNDGVLFNNGFLYSGVDLDKDEELWFSDGTPEGTAMLIDLDTAASSDPQDLTVVGNEVYFIPEIEGKTQLWKTDGTAAGTELVYLPTDTVDVEMENLTLYNDKLYFTLTTQADDNELWVYDFVSAGKIATIGANTGGFIEVDGVLFFMSEADATDSNSDKLWCTAGTSKTTFLVDSLFENNAVYTKADDEYAVIGSKLYFTADDTLGHDDIYMVDAAFVRNTIEPQETDLDDISGLYLYNDALYFEAEDQMDSIGDELYRYTFDGIPSLVLNINQDTVDTTPNGDPKYFIEYKGKLYFQGNAGDKIATGQELYVSDGTTAGTELVYDIYPGSGKDALPMEFFIMNDILYFYAKDGANSQIWKYDGVNTPEKVTNERSGGYFNPFYPVVDGNKAWLKGITDLGKYQLCTFDGENITVLTNNDATTAYSSGGILFNDGFLFNGADTEKDKELWFSNGTPEGTARVLDIDTAASSSPAELTVFNGEAYFVATIDEKTQLWKTDATAEGTMLVYDPADTIDNELENLAVINQKLVFTATNAEGTALYQLNHMGLTDVFKLADIADSPEDFYLHDNLLFFVAGDSLWYTEGTAASTMAVPAGIFEDSVCAQKVDGGEFVSNGTLLHFVAEENGQDVIITIDAADIARDADAQVYEMAIDDIAGLALYNGELYFEAEDKNNSFDDELYKMTANGEIVMVADINQDPDDSSPRSDPKYFTEYKGLLYFQANGGDNTGVDQELFVTDGSAMGTELVYDIYPGTGKGGLPMEMFVMNDILYFYAKDGANSQIWKYDGVNTPEKVTNERSGGYFNPFYPIVDGDKTWLKGITDLGKYQLCTFDGKDITVLTNNDVATAYSSGGILFNDGFLFKGTDTDKDSELWFSDGTAAGTARVLDIDTAASSSPAELTIFNNEVYFIAEVNEMTQIWKTDATAEGTELVYAPADTVDAEIENLNVIKGNLVFTANCPQGKALYKVIASGAEKIAQVGDSPEDFFELDELLFFVASDSLWVTEGTAASTKAVEAADFASGMVAEKVDGGEFVANGTVLYFVAEKDGSDVIASVDAADIDRDPAASIKETIAGNSAVAVELFPMPTNGVINIASAESFNTYKVFDLSMKEVAASAVLNNQINLDLEKGMYILQLENKTTIVAKTVVIK